jgi:hypothetical protein
MSQLRISDGERQVTKYPSKPSTKEVNKNGVGRNEILHRNESLKKLKNKET